MKPRRKQSRSQISPSDDTSHNKDNKIINGYQHEKELLSPQISYRKENTDERMLPLSGKHEMNDNGHCLEDFSNKPERIFDAKEDERSTLFQQNGKKNKLSFGSKRIMYVNKFVEKVKSFSSYVRFTKTKKDLFKMINDASFNYNYFYYKGIFTSENSLISRVWDFIQLLFLLSYIIYLPIRLAFQTGHQTSSSFYILEVLPNVTQIINMFLEFNTGYFSNGIVITDRSKIFSNYFRKKFIYDITLNICWLISLSPNVSDWVKTVGLLRIIVLMKLLGEMEQTFSLRELFGSYFSLCKLGGFIFLCAHLCGCCWYAIAVFEQEKGIETTWLTKDILNNQLQETIDQQVQSYVASIYWCIVTMTTIGYGDIYPATFGERIFGAFVCVLSSFMFAFSMSLVSNLFFILGDIIKSFSSKNEEFKEKMAVLNVYMKKRSLNLELQTRVRKYYENLFLEEKDDNEKGAEMIHALNEELKVDVLKEIFTIIFNQSKFLQQEFSSSMISKLHNHAEEKHIAENEYIFKQGDQPIKLYLILKGEVTLYLQNQLKIQSIGENKLVGLTEFLTNSNYRYSAKCSRFCQLVEIKYEHFFEAAKSSPLDYEKFCELKDAMVLKGDQMEYTVSCEGCGQQGHIFSHCQYINIASMQKTRFVQINKRIQLTRQLWLRRNLSYQAVKGFQHVSQRAVDFMSDKELNENVNMQYLIMLLKLEGSFRQDDSPQNSDIGLEDEIFENKKEQNQQQINDQITFRQNQKLSGTPTRKQSMNKSPTIINKDQSNKNQIQSLPTTPHQEMKLNRLSKTQTFNNNNMMMIEDFDMEEQVNSGRLQADQEQTESIHAVTSNVSACDAQDNLLAENQSNKLVQQESEKQENKLKPKNALPHLDLPKKSTIIINSPTSAPFDKSPLELSHSPYQSINKSSSNIQSGNPFNYQKRMSVLDKSGSSRKQTINLDIKENRLSVQRPTLNVLPQNSDEECEEQNQNKVENQQSKIDPIDLGSNRRKFDSIKDFLNYFSYNNSTSILSGYNKLIDKNLVYLQLIEKAKIKQKEKQSKQKSTQLKVKRANSHKRIPSTQSHYQKPSKNSIN